MHWALIVYAVGFVGLTLLWRHELGKPPKPMRGIEGDLLALALGILWPLVLAFSLAMALVRLARPREDSDG